MAVSSHYYVNLTKYMPVINVLCSKRISGVRHEGWIFDHQVLRYFKRILNSFDDSTSIVM